MDDKAADTSGGEVVALFEVDRAPVVVAAAGRAGRPRRGRHEKALAKSLRDAGLTTRRDAASTSLAHAYARAMDLAEERGNFYAIAQTGKSYMELLKSMGLLDESGPRGAGDDDEQGILDGMGATTVDDGAVAG